MINKKYILLIQIVIISLSFSCQKESTQVKRSRYLNEYINQTFPELQLKDGDYLFILPGGCGTCKRSLLLILSNQYNIINSYSNGVFLSLNTKSLYRDIDFSQFNNVYIDNSDKLDQLALGIYGISMLKIKNGLIIGSKSLNSEDLEKGFKYFFVKPYQIAK